jgi:hypothetical protein
VLTGDDDTITLKDAAEHYGYTVSTLKAEAKKCRLTTYKIGKRLYTTPADIKEMVRLCRVEQKARAFTLIRNEANGSSATDRASSALAAAKETALALRGSSRNISPSNTSQKHRVRR